MFNLNQLNHFRLVTETGNFAAAARRAHITQPALSNSIRTLEEHIGVQLFDRSERPVRVTSAGRDLLLRIDSLLTEAKNLEKEIGYLSQGMAGELRIGMTAHSAASIGGAILGNWLAENGKVRADVTVADTLALIDLLREENLDLIIGDGRDLPVTSSEFEMTPLPPQQGGAILPRWTPCSGFAEAVLSGPLALSFCRGTFPASDTGARYRDFQAARQACHRVCDSKRQYCRSARCSDTQ